MKKEIRSSLLVAAFLAQALAPESASAQSAPTTPVGPQQLGPQLSEWTDNCPLKVGGDRDYDANGPDVNWTLDLLLSPGQRNLDLLNDFTAIETQADWTEARERAVNPNQTQIQMWRFDEQCMRIDSLNSSVHSEYRYLDWNHDLDYANLMPNELARQMQVRGDTSNSDIGNCTGDDTKFSAWFNDADVTVGTNPSDPDPVCVQARIEKAQQAARDNLDQALASFVSSIQMLLDGVQILPPPQFLADASSFSSSGTNTIFSMLPYTDGSRYTFFLDDLNSNSVSISPDGGGYKLRIEFEEAGTEVRSICETKIWKEELGEFLDPGDLTQQQIQDLIDDGWNWLVCPLGGEYKAELTNVVVEIRFYLGVNKSTSKWVVKPITGIDPERDVFIELTVQSQSGPCVENLMAIQDDCRESPELELEFGAMLQRQLATQLTNWISNQGSNIFGEITTIFETEIGAPAANTIGVFVGDVDGSNYGDIFFVRH